MKLAQVLLLSIYTLVNFVLILVSIVLIIDRHWLLLIGIIYFWYRMPSFLSRKTIKKLECLLYQEEQKLSLEDFKNSLVEELGVIKPAKFDGEGSFLLDEDNGKSFLLDYEKLGYYNRE